MTVTQMHMKIIADLLLLAPIIIKLVSIRLHILTHFIPFRVRQTCSRVELLLITQTVSVFL